MKNIWRKPGLLRTNTLRDWNKLSEQADWLQTKRRSSAQTPLSIRPQEAIGPYGKRTETSPESWPRLPGSRTKMAAARCCKLVPRRGLSLHAATEASASATKVSDPEVTATPVARYPPIVASMTADSKAARLRRVLRWQAAVHAAPTVDEKIRILTKMQFKKYMVYPQTFALNADRWYQGFTKTVFLSGLPPAPAPSPPSLDLASLRAAVCDCILQEHFYLRRRRPLFDHRQALASPVLDQLVGTLVNLLTPLNPALTTAALGKPAPLFQDGDGVMLASAGLLAIPGLVASRLPQLV